MLEQIFKNISPELLKGLTQNFGMDQGQASQAIATTKDGFMDGLSKELTSGNISGLLDLFNQKGSQATNPVFQNLASSLSSQFAKKMGMAPDRAGLITNFLLPKVLSALSNNSNGNISQNDLMDIIGKAAGSSISGKFGDMLKGGLGNLFK